jgi:hypothetical protein
MVVEIVRDGEARRARWTVQGLPGIGQRIEGSLVGEALISGLVSVVLIIGVVWNLPDSEVKRSLAPTLKPIAAAAGLEATWQMYAPEPISRLETVEVDVTMANGDRRVWTNRRGDRVVGPFSWYRWQKLKENAPREAGIRAGIAHWVIRELTGPLEHPIGVQMILRTEQLPPPGEDRPKTIAVETLYDENLTARP